MITYQMITDAASAWHRTNGVQRFGQYFINHYMPSDTVWPELFYETDRDKCISMLLERLPVVELTIPEE